MHLMSSSLEQAVRNDASTVLDCMTSTEVYPSMLILLQSIMSHREFGHSENLWNCWIYTVRLQITSRVPVNGFGFQRVVDIVPMYDL